MTLQATFKCLVCRRDRRGTAANHALRICSPACWRKIADGPPCRACGRSMPRTIQQAYQQEAQPSPFPGRNFCSSYCREAYRVRRANEAQREAERKARRLNRLCRICDAKIPPARIERWPNVRTCSPDCSAENRRAIVRAAVARHYRRQRKGAAPAGAASGRLARRGGLVAAPLDGSGAEGLDA